MLVIDWAVSGTHSYIILMKILRKIVQQMILSDNQDIYPIVHCLFREF